jgi:c-di-GMP-binding flagellar brake protein YcgR
MLIIIAGILLILLIFVLLKVFGSDNFPWIHFYTRGRESGFNFQEINLLRRAAVENQIQNPVSLFWSVRQLDRCLRSMIIRLRSNNNDKISSEMISKLFDFRKKVEFNQPKYKIGITTSRKISVRQIIKISLPGVGSYTSTVVENLKKYFAISYPLGPKLPVGFSWNSQRINAYFWRGDDAGYVFETKILNDYTDTSKVPILHVAHSDSLVRSQKRNSVRADVNKNAYLYSLKSIDDRNENIEQTAGIRCRLLDISEDGAAILIGGRAKAGLPVKLQIKLSSQTIVMTGIIRGVNFNQNKNQSVLHMKSVPLSFNMKNNVLSYVYNLFPDK